MGAPQTSLRRGFTLVELLVALALFSLLVLAVVRLLDGSLRVLGESEGQRDRLALELVTSEWLLGDLAGLASGEDGDLLVDWWTYDQDGDGIASRPWPRLRLVRRAAPRDLLRLGLRKGSEDAVEQDLGVGRLMRSDALVEVVWCVQPAAREQGEPSRGDGLLLRGERVLTGPKEDSFFAPNFFDGSGAPPGAVAQELARGLLWFDLWLADETSLLHGAWNLGSQSGDVARAWDAWGLGRTDLDRHAFNQTLPRPTTGDLALRLPRRMRIEFEFEPPMERERRPKLTAEIDAEARFLPLDAPTRLPEPGSLLLLGEEWVELVSASSSGAQVSRAQRGTRAAVHRPGERLQWGQSFAREFAPAPRREDWRR